jgi:hypothetical protein
LLCRRFHSRTAAQQGQLERRRRLRRGKRTHRRGRRDFTRVRNRRDVREARRILRTDAYVHGLDPTPQGRYSDTEIQELGEEGKALKMPIGGYAYPILNLADLMNALAAYKTTDGDKTGVRSWIIERAILLGLVDRLPKGWATPKQKLHPNELDRVRGGGEAKGGMGGEAGLPDAGGRVAEAPPVGGPRYETHLRGGFRLLHRRGAGLGAGTPVRPRRVRSFRSGGRPSSYTRPPSPQPCARPAGSAGAVSPSTWAARRRRVPLVATRLPVGRKRPITLLASVGRVKSGPRFWPFRTYSTIANVENAAGAGLGAGRAGAWTGTGP